jgi:hypothetical protein
MIRNRLKEAIQEVCAMILEIFYYHKAAAPKPNEKIRECFFFLLVLLIA